MLNVNGSVYQTGNSDTAVLVVDQSLVNQVVAQVLGGQEVDDKIAEVREGKVVFVKHQIDALDMRWRVYLEECKYYTSNACDHRYRYHDFVFFFFFSSSVQALGRRKCATGLTGDFCNETCTDVSYYAGAGCLYHDDAATNLQVQEAAAFIGFFEYVKW